MWAKAYAKASANEEKAKALYIELRVQAFRDELDLYKIHLQEKEEKRTPLKSNSRNADRLSKESVEILEREKRVKNSLREKLGREPTEREINTAKWDGMCL